MISLEATMYTGKNKIIIREWDGYDKPQYYPVMDITDDEIGFAGGRFRKYQSRVNDFPATNRLYLLIKSPIREFEPIFNWIGENIEGYWNVDIEDVFCEPLLVFSFESEEDSILFKLTWDAKKSKYDTFLEN